MSMIPWAAMAAASGIAGYWNPIAQPGEPGYTNQPQHHLRAMMENDSAFGDDCNYSHGTRIDYARNISEDRAWGISLTQNIYTPERHGRRNIPGEHPYAGYMALGGAYIMQGRNTASTFELQAGATGNASLARYMQNGLHEACGMATWDGWSSQVPSEATVQLTMRQDFRLPWPEFSCGPWQTDAMAYAREQVGTMFISGGVGISVRFGHNLPAAMQVNGNCAGNYGIGTLLKEDYKRDEISYFLIGSLYGSYVARDITIDGGVFHHFDQTCSRQPWQLEGQIGIGVVCQGIDYFAGMIYHSDTYRTQKEDSFYGTFSISWHW